MTLSVRGLPLRKMVASFAMIAVLTTTAVVAQQRPDKPAGSTGPAWITLGTVGGPMPQPDRGEPANLLLANGAAYLVDTGDGAATRMLNAGVDIRTLRGIFISHIHFDHIGGLFGVLGLRLQMRVTTPLAIYGPPGTKAIVAGLVQAMRPSAESGFGVPGEVPIAPDMNLTVIELDDGSVVNVGPLTVRAAANTHYSFPPSSEAARRFRSLSFRFELPGHSLTYTGDTGPSEAVEKLAKGSDVLVTEMIDLEETVVRMRQRARQMSIEEAEQMMQHFRTHHLTTDEISTMASKAGVKKVIVTHLAGGAGTSTAKYAQQIQHGFSGPVTIASDGDRFDF